MNKLESALIMAINTHKGQKDKGEMPYIFHCVSVMNIAKEMFSEYCESAEELEDMLTVALLHDTIEDGKITEEDISFSFGRRVGRSVATLTKKGSIKYDDYINNIKKNKIAMLVKMADLSHNMDTRRLKNISAHDIVRIKKYENAYVQLRIELEKL